MALYDTYTLLDVLRVQKTPLYYFLDTCFQSQVNFDTPEIAFDRVYGDDRYLAPFVVPNVQGRNFKFDGYDSKTFKPAYVKPKNVVDPNMFIPRQPGEALGTGSLTIGQRRDAVIAELLRQHKVRHRNRQEWMAAKAIADGKVTIKGEDYPETLVDFRRHASLSYVLGAGARWNELTADPLADLKAARVNANNRSGARISTHIFGADAWDAFAARVNLKDLMDTRYGGSDSRVTLMRDGFGDTIEYMGVIQGLNGAGRIEAWVHTGKFIDSETNTEEFLIDQKSVVGFSRDTVRGVRCFGAIKDKGANYQPLEIYAKNWEQEDPSVEYLLSQSAPLMVPREPNATFSAKVLA